MEERKYKQQPVEKARKTLSKDNSGSWTHNVQTYNQNSHKDRPERGPESAPAPRRRCKKATFLMEW